MYEGLKQEKELWNLFTKVEEYNFFISDKHNRFRYYLSQHRNIFEPQASKFLIENGYKISYPEDEKFAVCLTHDIDALNFPKLTTMFDSYKALLKGQIRSSLILFKSLINKKNNPWQNIKEIIKLEEKYNAKSSFYFLTLDKNEIDFNFNIEDLEPELKYIIDNGCEVGLHGGFGEYNNLEKIKEKKMRLEKIIDKKVLGYRNHYLKFKIPDTWEVLNKAGFKYDTTFGYADCVGFRNGMCHPFKPYNLKTEKEIDILEIPLIIMDFTLFDYMHLEIDESWKIIKLLIDTVEQYKGVITILWHNTSMVNEKYRLYEKILSYCTKQNAWCTTCNSIADWWQHQPDYLG
jgi:peptidoglycan/xylan/chitin deacetylase (PgdA/CDA1 family)